MSINSLFRKGAVWYPLAMERPLVQVQNLRYRYPENGEDTLRGLKFSLEPGMIYGFLGPSGAGKSTTQKILYRLLPGYTGSVQIDGREIRRWDHSLFSLLGIGFETPNLYQKLTGRENLELALSLGAPGQTGQTGQKGQKGQYPGKSVDEAAERLGLQEDMDRRVETDSKGMAMRLAFIRAVLHRPRLLFLDEPTAGLDPLWARGVKDWILELRREGTGIFLTTHSMELADELCGTVGFLIDGELLVQDSPAALKRQYGRTGVVVQGRDSEGKETERTVSYRELQEEGAVGFSEVTRVVNREVNLEEVFLQVTGRRLQGGGVDG